MAVAIYARVSTEEQRERQSIDTQLEQGQRFCDYQKLQVYRIFADNGVSGTVPLDRRPEGSEILAGSPAGQVRSAARLQAGPAWPRNVDAHSERCRGA
jgi:site-specific DNA recombinase